MSLAAEHGKTLGEVYGLPGPMLAIEHELWRAFYKLRDEDRAEEDERRKAEAGGV